MGHPTDELIFRIDFSENYVTKFSSEVQSTHFGASKKQICLNTGVRYAFSNGKVESLCFASVSDSLDHQAHAVWAHMRPVLEKSAEEFPNTSSIHIFSDSPSSQYRNRYNMYLFKTLMPQYFDNLKTISWNFTESGHGKGPMDGVGGTLKRGADAKVLHGTDITCAKDFVTSLQEHKIMLVEIPPTDVSRLKNVVADLKVPPIQGIMKVHQVTWCMRGPLQSRLLSCFTCAANKICTHYHHKVINLDCDIESTARPHRLTKNSKLSVEEVYTDSSDCEDDVPEDHLVNQQTTSKSQSALTIEDIMKKYSGEVKESELVSGAHIVVKYKMGKKISGEKYFIGVCQSTSRNNEVDVMFLKDCAKDSTMFFTNESDFASVTIEQIISIIPPPTLSLKGNRVFYRFF